MLISSSAVRAVATAEAMAAALEYSWDGIVVEEGLYEADAGEILELIEEQDDWVDRLMLVGHNPGLTVLANHLSSLHLENLPTCGVLELTYEIEGWWEVDRSRPVAVFYDYPKKGRGQPVLDPT